MQFLAAMVAGVLFGAGLTVAQMVDPQKVLGFLDIAGIAKGTWDPTLLMVFMGALPTMFVAYQLRHHRLSRPALSDHYAVPQRNDIDVRLVGGSAIFGAGWGLAGVCPGPAITALALTGDRIGTVLIFVVAMLAGIAVSWLVAPASPREKAEAARLEA
jgi:uncharacterized membrane protein YedE/YeeE